jgi:hypothetical protein
MRQPTRRFPLAAGRYLVVSRAGKEVKEWVEKICGWGFQTIIPAHFSAPLKAGPQDVKQAYYFLYADDKKSSAAPKPLFGLPSFFPPPKPQAQEPNVVFPERDLGILKALDKFVSATGLAN